MARIKELKGVFWNSDQPADSTNGRVSYLEAGIITVKDTGSKREVRFTIEELEAMLDFARAGLRKEEEAA